MRRINFSFRRRRFITVVGFLSVFVLTLGYAAYRTSLAVEGLAQIDKHMEVKVNGLTTTTIGSSNYNYSGSSIYLRVGNTSTSSIIKMYNSGNMKAYLDSVNVVAGGSSKVSYTLCAVATDSVSAACMSNALYISGTNSLIKAYSFETNANPDLFRFDNGTIYYVKLTTTCTSCSAEDAKELLITFNWIQDKDTPYIQGDNSTYMSYAKGSYVIYNPVSNTGCSSTTFTNCHGWYVLENSDQVTSTVKLIRAGNLGCSYWGTSSNTNNGPTAANSKLNTLTSNWVSTISKRLPSATDIANAVGVSLTSNPNTSPSGYEFTWIGGDPYWTSTACPMYNVASGAAWYVSPYAIFRISIGASAWDTTGLYIGVRPVVTVSKSNLSGITSAPTTPTTSVSC